MLGLIFYRHSSILMYAEETQLLSSTPYIYNNTTSMLTSLLIKGVNNSVL
jgi:hypothetical protein